MKEVSPKITRASCRLVANVLLGIFIALILNACIMPLSIADFLSDERVKRLAEGGGIQYEYDHPTDLAPVLIVTVDGAFKASNPLTVHKDETIEIIVNNASDFAGIIDWYHEDTTTSINSGPMLTFTAGITPYEVNESHTITVTGTSVKDDKPYSSSVILLIIW